MNKTAFYQYYIHSESERNEYYEEFSNFNKKYIITNKDIDINTIDHKIILIQDVKGKIEISRRRKKVINLQFSFVELKRLYAIIKNTLDFDYYFSYDIKYLDKKSYDLMIYQNDEKKVKSILDSKEKL